MRDVNELIRLCKRQGPEEHSVDDRKHGAICADHEREGQNGGDGEDRRSSQSAAGKTGAALDLVHGTLVSDTVDQTELLR